MEFHAAALAISASVSDTTVLSKHPASSCASGTMDYGPLKKASIAIVVRLSSWPVTLVFAAFAPAFFLIPQSAP